MINIEIFGARNGVGSKAVVTQTIVVGPYIPSEVKLLGTVSSPNGDIGFLLELVQKMLTIQGIEKVGDER